MLLPVALDEPLRRLPAEPPGGRGRHRAGVDRVEVAPGREHLGPAAGRGAGGAGLEEPALEGGEHALDLGRPARLDRGPDAPVRLLQHRPGSAPRRRARTAPADEGAGERFQALDGIAGRPPRRRSAVQGVQPVQAVQGVQGVQGARERRGAGPRPRGPEVAVEGVEPVEPEVTGERPREGRARALVRAARQADERNEEVEELVRARAAAEDVQAVPDLHLLELAQVRVQLGEGLAGLLAGGDAAVPIEPEAGHEVEDLFAQNREAARVHPRRLVVLVDEAFEIGERAVALRPGEGRRQVVDDDRLRAPLGLRPLARVVDDERIDVRQGAERRLREARSGEGEGLSRQPFEVPVLPHVHDGVHPRPQPGVEREVAVRGNEVGVVVAGRGVDVVAPRRLEPDHDVAEAKRRHRHRCFRLRLPFRLPFPGRRQEVRIPLRPPPSLANRLAHCFGQAGVEREVVGEGKPLPDLAPGYPRIRRPGGDRLDEGVAARGDAVHAVAGGGHRPQEAPGSPPGYRARPRCRAARPGSDSSRARWRCGGRRPACRRDRSTPARDRR